MNAADVKIREFRSADRKAVLELSIRAWEQVYDAWRVILGDKLYAEVYPDWRTSQTDAVSESVRANHAFVAVSQGVVSGFVTAVQHPEQVGEIDMLAVDPHHQRKGIGRALLDEATNDLRRQGVKRVELGTGGDPGHAAARRVYERAGFVGLPLVHYYKQL